MPNQSDADAGRGLQSDRTMEFVALLRRHDHQLATFVHAAVPSWQDAEDVIQETSVRLWEQFDKFERGTNFGAWACTVARYLIMARWEKAGRNREQLSPEVIDRIAGVVEQTAGVMEDRREHLSECIEQISAANRQLLRLCYEEGMKIRDIAELLDRSANATYLSISRVRRWLHDCVNRRLNRSSVGAEQ